MELYWKIKEDMRVHIANKEATLCDWWIGALFGVVIATSARETDHRRTVQHLVARKATTPLSPAFTVVNMLPHTSFSNRWTRTLRRSDVRPEFCQHHNRIIEVFYAYLHQRYTHYGAPHAHTWSRLRSQTGLVRRFCSAITIDG
jgi:hypothetical protein